MAARLWRLARRANTRRKLSIAATARSSRPDGLREVHAVAPQAPVSVPAQRPGSVRRTALVNRLRAARAVPVITLVAPAGYGKTTVLAQWAERDERPFAWVALDERDCEPAALMRRVAAALEGVGTLEPSVLRSVHSSKPSNWTSVAPGLARAFASVGSPCVLVLDGASGLRLQDSIEVVSMLATHV